VGVDHAFIVTRLPGPATMPTGVGTQHLVSAPLSREPLRRNLGLQLRTTAAGGVMSHLLGFATSRPILARP
jgi:hypothetical protein